PGVDLGGGDVDGAAGDLHAVGKGVLDAVPAGERRQECGGGVQDPAAVAVEDQAVQDRAVPGHGDQVDVRLVKGGDHPLGVRCPVEGLAEVVPFDHRGGDPGPGGDVDGTAGTVDHDGHDGQRALEDGVEDRPAPRGQHTDAHGRNL